MHPCNSVAKYFDQETASNLTPSLLFLLSLLSEPFSSLLPSFPLPLPLPKTLTCGLDYHICIVVIILFCFCLAYSLARLLENNPDLSLEMKF